MENAIKKEETAADLVGNLIAAWKYLWSKWRLILLIAFLSGLIGIAFAWLQKPVYVAEMSFTTETESSSKLSAYAGLAAQFGFDLGGSTNNIFEGDNLVELFKSRALVEKTLLAPSGNQNRLMIDEYLVSNDIEVSAKKGQVSFTGDASSNTRLEDSLLSEIYGAIAKKELEVFRKDKKLSIIIIRMKSRSEPFSKRFVEVLAANAIQFYTDYKSRKSRQNVELLQRQVDSVRRMLFGGMAEVATITDLNVNPTRQIMRTPAQRKQIDVQANGVLYGELLKNLELSKLSLRKETPLIQVIDTPRYPLEKKKLGRLKGAVIFAFLGGVFAIIFFLSRRYVKSGFNSQAYGTR